MPPVASTSKRFAPVELAGWVPSPQTKVWSCVAWASPPAAKLNVPDAELRLPPGIVAKVPEAVLCCPPPTVASGALATLLKPPLTVQPKKLDRKSVGQGKSLAH